MGFNCKVKCIETGIVYNSVKDAAMAVGLANGTGIIACCNKRRKLSKGYHWEYYEEPNLPGEIWKDAKCITNGELYDFTGEYLASNKGRIKIVKNKQIMTGTIEEDGYTRVKINDIHHSVHRIIATTFIPNDDPENKTQVNHIKEKEKSNNCVENLEWCTPKYNANYGTRNERTCESKMKKYGKISTGIDVAIRVREKKVHCVTTGEIFDSISKACQHYKLHASSICRCCKKDSTYCGKLSDGTKLVWEYYNEDSE